MRIGIDANPIMRHRGGVGWHTYYLLRALVERKDDGIEYVAYIEPGADRSPVFREGWAQSPRLQWKTVPRWLMPLRGRLDCLDVFHSPNFKLQTEGRSGAVVTIHDLWLVRFPQYSTKVLGQRQSFRRMRRRASRARHIITASHHSAADIVEMCGVARDQITVIHHGVAEDFRPVSQKEALSRLQATHRWPTDRYILFIGGADPRKNHRLLIEAYAARASELRSHTLVMAGPATHRFGDIRATAHAQQITDRVVCPGPLDIDELKVLYTHADAFVFPSLYEGFGMPVLEAMACGAPVIASNATSLPEVAGEAAILVDPHDAEELARRLVEVVSDADVRASLREKGFARARSFTWQRTADQTMAVYQQVVGKPR